MRRVSNGTKQTIKKFGGAGKWLEATERHDSMTRPLEFDSFGVGFRTFGDPVAQVWQWGTWETTKPSVLQVHSIGILTPRPPNPDYASGWSFGQIGVDLILARSTIDSPALDLHVSENPSALQYCVMSKSIYRRMEHVHDLPATKPCLLS